ncbi:GntR family transcriptional regulator [Altererythrobacter sp. GH1-8]|uniref:GntR family transcriptional regulator n=1 Tax=Altererythrobacter sp. GH1-8 TaxID=3349333 RepID=UPI00374CB96C
MSVLAEQIQDLILDGVITPGEKLDEHALAKRFDVSRTPIREALHQIASTGLIELKPNRGAYVTSLSGSEKKDFFIAMTELESTCARLAAMSMTPGERSDLLRLHETMGQLAARKLIDEFELANEELHNMILEGARNQPLADMTRTVRNRLRDRREKQFKSIDRIAHSHAEHELVVRAIVTGDPAAAHGSMLHHMDRSGASYREMIRAMAKQKVSETAD